MRRGIRDATTLLSIEGDAGSASFGGGNVLSQSTIDNIEIVHMKDLQQGEYVVEITRIDSGSTAAQLSAAWQVDPIGFDTEGDVDGSGKIDSGDVSLVLLNMGTDDPASDVDLSGLVDSADVAAILLNMN